MAKIDPKQYVDVSHAAEIAGVSRLWIRTLAQRGELGGVEIDGHWFVKRTAVQAYQPHPTKGRKGASKG